MERNRCGSNTNWPASFASPSRQLESLRVENCSIHAAPLEAAPGARTHSAHPGQKLLTQSPNLVANLVGQDKRSRPITVRMRSLKGDGTSAQNPACRVNIYSHIHRRPLAVESPVLLMPSSTEPSTTVRRFDTVSKSHHLRSSF